MTHIKKGLRQSFARGEINAATYAARLKFELAAPEDAIAELEAQLARGDDPQLSELLIQCHLTAGNPYTARMLAMAHYQTYRRLHVTNLILSRQQVISAIVDDSAKVLYVPMPKCGSSTLKNIFTKAMYGQTYGELVHFRHPEMYRRIDAAELTGKYASYFKFCMVRDPVDRLVSYYTTNIDSGSLRKEALNLNHVLSLATKPAPGAVVRQFQDYRRIFMDFRHHTDAMSGYLPGAGQEMDRIFSLPQMGELRGILEGIYGTSLDVPPSMVGRPDPDMKAKCKSAFAALKPYYAEDYQRFGPYL